MRVARAGLEQQPPHPVRRARLVRVRGDAEDGAVGAPLRARRLRLVGLDEVVPDAVRVAGERDPPHRVRHVVVEAGEEAEAVLAGERLAAAARGARAPGCCAPCRRAPWARRRPRGSRARRARARPPGRPCRRPARPRGSRARRGTISRPGPAQAGVAASAAAAAPAFRTSRRESAPMQTATLWVSLPCEWDTFLTNQGIALGRCRVRSPS